MPAYFHLESWLANGYVLLLLIIAAGLEWMGRHSHRRASQYHTGGFRFHKDADHWECPHGARLERAEIDNELRVIRDRPLSSRHVAGAARAGEFNHDHRVVAAWPRAGAVAAGHCSGGAEPACSERGAWFAKGN